MMRFTLNGVLVALLLIAFCACRASGVDGAGDAAIGGVADGVSDAAIAVAEDNVAEELLLPASLRREPQWAYFNELCGYIGMGAQEIVSETDMIVEYRKISDDLETLALHDGEIRSILCDGEIWDSDSKCVGVFASSILDVPNTVSEMTESLGSAILEESGGQAYYLYAFGDGIEVRVYADGEGTELSGVVLVKKISAAVSQSPSVLDEIDSVKLPAAISAKERDRPEFEKMQRLYAYIGKTAEEILTDYPNALFNDETGYWFDDETDIAFIAPWETSTCQGIDAPALLVFDNWNNGAITRNELSEYWDVAYSWDYLDSPFYCYTFDDIWIWVDSDIDGVVTPESRVIMKFD